MNRTQEPHSPHESSDVRWCRGGSIQRGGTPNSNVSVGRISHRAELAVDRCGSSPRTFQYHRDWLLSGNDLWPNHSGCSLDGIWSIIASKAPAAFISLDGVIVRRDRDQCWPKWRARQCRVRDWSLFAWTVASASAPIRGFVVRLRTEIATCRLRATRIRSSRASIRHSSANHRYCDRRRDPWNRPCDRYAMDQLCYLIQSRSSRIHLSWCRFGATHLPADSSHTDAPLYISSRGVGARPDRTRDCVGASAAQVIAWRPWARVSTLHFDQRVHGDDDTSRADNRPPQRLQPLKAAISGNGVADFRPINSGPRRKTTGTYLARGSPPRPTDGPRCAPGGPWPTGRSSGPTPTWGALRNDVLRRAFRA